MPTPDSFHYFFDLPPELRFTIWELALRPALPAAHFFTIRERKDKIGIRPIVPRDQPASSQALVCICNFSRKSAYCPRTSTLVPSCTWEGYRQAQLEQEEHASPENSGWKNVGFSAYLVDSGLWSACAESRMIIAKRFGMCPAPRTSCMPVYDPCREWLLEADHRRTEAPTRGPAPTELPDPPCAAGSVGPAPDMFPVIVDAKQDLFCIRAAYDIRYVEEVEDAMKAFFTDDTRWPRHVAFELNAYDYSGSSAAAREQFPQSWYMFRAAAACHRVWVIDYSIRRCRPDPIDRKEPRQTFYAGDCRFREVRREDHEWKGQRGALQTLDAIPHKLVDTCSQLGCRCYVPWSLVVAGRDAIGVLACERAA